MAQDFYELATNQIARQPMTFMGGRVVQVSDGLVSVGGVSDSCRIGERVAIHSDESRRVGEIVRLTPNTACALIEGGTEGIAIGDMVRISAAPKIYPDASWLGRVIDPDGAPLDGKPILQGRTSARLANTPPPAQQRKRLGVRLETGVAVFNTLLPIVRGQRIGLFAGSGVGKSTLLGDLACGVTADVVVVALVGERGREVRQFVEDVLGPEGLAKSVVVAATSDRSPQMRRRCAQTATAIAEHFRDQNLHVLLLVDSVTRFCEAHRETAIAAGEESRLRGFPASTAAAIAGLCERAGPGVDGSGDITAVFSVLVSGSDMDEPVADMLRGVLDGHVVLDRTIAERGRFPAVDVVRSVSRSLPQAASEIENDLIRKARQLLSAHDAAEMMIQSGLYVSGSDPLTDKAVERFDDLEGFLAQKGTRDVMGHFALLRRIVG